MTTIAKDANVVTVVNVFTVEPENQQRLIDVLVQATESVISKLDGYVSANFHRSLDGTRVVNYAQWRSREQLGAMLGSAEAQEHLHAAAALATSVEPNLYEVAFTHSVG
ncbi:MAG: antibiotic biosynthesis monooxygenase [Egibacteraceae bacterium]